MGAPKRGRSDDDGQRGATVTTTAGWAAPTPVQWAMPSDTRGSASTHGTGLLAGIAGDGDRFAVVDLETTGLYNSDRVIEVAVVTLNLDGMVVDEWSTLVDPGRDVGPTSIHGISARDVVGAPRFEDIADELGSRMHGACLVGHNLRGFDARMLRNEFGRLGRLAVDLGEGVDTLRLTGSKLPIACAEFGIHLAGWHSALEDARAAGHLLALAGSRHEGASRAVRSLGLMTRPCEPRSRVAPAVIAHVPWLLFALSTIDLDRIAPDDRPYIDLLERVVADRRITSEERVELGDLARTLGLSPGRQQEAHRQFVHALVDRATDDGVVTDDEMVEVLAIAALLEVDERGVLSRTSLARRTRGSVQLLPGMRVCFTGEPVLDGAAVPRSVLQAHAHAIGLETVGSVTKTTELLVAADTASQSGKATKAQELAIPIVDALDFLSAVPADVLAAEVTRTRSRSVQMCAACGAAIVLEPGQARRAGRRCEACSGGELLKPERPRSSRTASGPTAVEAEEELVCGSCGRAWTRPRQRGRKPQRCSDCT